jgi:hypothetical protein
VRRKQEVKSLSLLSAAALHTRTVLCHLAIASQLMEGEKSESHGEEGGDDGPHSTIVHRPSG